MLKKRFGTTTLVVDGLSGLDYILTSDSVWITVGPVSLRIQKRPSLAIVEAFPSGNECEAQLGQLIIDFGEARAEGGKDSITTTDDS